MLKKTAILFYSLFTFTTAFAQHETVENQHGKPVTETPALSEKDERAKVVKEFVDHHILDAHDVALMVKDGHHIGFPLPIVIYDEGFHTFMSNTKGVDGHEFIHGSPVESDGKFYTLNHEKIYRTDSKGTLTLDEAHHPTEKRVLDLSITKSVLTILFVAIVLLVIFGGMARSYKKSLVPSGAAKFLEPLIIFIRDDIAIPNIGHKYKRFMGYLLTVFFFILFLNVLGLMPFGINVTGNIAITFFLAILTYLITTFSGSKDYWKHIFWMPGVPVPMKFIMMPIELLGTLTKPFALMIRLFANMTAGHIVVMTLIGSIYIFQNWIAGVAFPFLTLVIYLLEVLVAFLQAYIFTMLSALFIGMAVEEHEHDHAH
ncbi:F0F1 ATP synthase subunit A [Chryseobacterium sp. FH1]|uniref:F0F1 ATP synthase subunit A n=1 Tax=Chryseobacterium sp. FH1 TaxID=1233951 RepID=UPI0004E3FB43|nr:F0F1 ATP synthase subunit A [Chryseobacterium sp. FH1]KFC21728.1 ATP synthase F0 subunit A [Chryseobacterium sp. FH1]